MTRKANKKICKCGKPSVPGLKKGISLCQYHYDVFMFGIEWADKVKNGYGERDKP